MPPSTSAKMCFAMELVTSSIQMKKQHWHMEPGKSMLPKSTFNLNAASWFSHTKTCSFSFINRL